MRKTTILVFSVAAIILVAGSYFTPHWTIYQMRSAIDRRDAMGLSKHIDFPSLRESFKGLMLIEVSKKMKSPEMDGNPFAGLGQMIAVRMVDQLVDTMVSPAGVMLMMSEGSPKLGLANDDAAQKDKQAPQYAVRYRDWTTVEVRSKFEGQPGAFLFIRDGLVSWKLASVELPST